MRTLDVTQEGLRVLADQCVVSASELADAVPAPAVGPSAQATAAAVSSAYAALDATASALADRVRTTGGELGLAAARYASTDDASAQWLTAQL